MTPKRGQTYRSADPTILTRIRVVGQPGSRLHPPGTIHVVTLIAGGRESRPRTMAVADLHADWILEAGQ